MFRKDGFLCQPFIAFFIPIIPSWVTSHHLSFTYVWDCWMYAGLLLQTQDNFKGYKTAVREVDIAHWNYDWWYLEKSLIVLYAIISVLSVSWLSAWIQSSTRCAYWLAAFCWYTLTTNNHVKVIHFASKEGGSIQSGSTLSFSILLDTNNRWTLIGRQFR